MAIKAVSTSRTLTEGKGGEEICTLWFLLLFHVCNISMKVLYWNCSCFIVNKAWSNILPYIPYTLFLSFFVKYMFRKWAMFWLCNTMHNATINKIRAELAIQAIQQSCIYSSPFIHPFQGWSRPTRTVCSCCKRRFLGAGGCCKKVKGNCLAFMQCLTVVSVYKLQWAVYRTIWSVLCTLQGVLWSPKAIKGGHHLQNTLMGVAKPWYYRYDARDLFLWKLKIMPLKKEI